MSKTEAELWHEVLSGSAAAWSELVGRYQPLVYAVATRFGLSAADAADCFQQTWVALFENRKRLKDPSRLSAWLVTTAKREALRLRHEADRTRGETSTGEAVDANPLPDQELELLQRQAQLGVAIRELEPRCRRLVDLFFFAPKKYSYDEIASDLGMTSNSLGAYRRRCLQRLQRILARNGFLEARNGTPGTL
jgi:RNA polymerase sigma factor (sigma-70 family)